MIKTIHRYPILVKEINLDLYGHVNNATYLTFFEEARWDFINQHGFGVKTINETGFGPIILEANIKFIKEILLRQEVIIETVFVSAEKKIGKMKQRMLRGTEECCVAEFKLGLFDLKNRKLVYPTPEWLKACGLQSTQ